MSIAVIDIDKTTAKAIEKHQKALKGINKKRLYAWIGFAAREEAEEFSEYVKDAWLKGKALKYQTGETYHSVRPWTNKRHEISVRPGVVGLDGAVPINGMLNYLNKWTGTKHEFMRPAFSAWNGQEKIAKAVEDNISKMVDRVAKEIGR